MCIHPQGCTHTPTCAPYSSVHLYVLRLLHVVGGCKEPPYILDTSFTPPLYGVPPLQFTPHSFISFPVHWYVLGISVYHTGIFPLCWGFWSVPHLLGFFGGISRWDVHMLILVYFVVHHVSHFYDGYDYYSSSYGGIFWPVQGFISDHGSFPDGVSCNLGSACSGSTTTLSADRLWKCYCLCTIEATSIFIASSGLCQLCYGFSTGRFLFPTVLYIICLVSVLVSAFYF